MKQVKVSVPDYVYAFYAKVGRSVGRPVAEVMSEALFYKAGELAQESHQNYLKLMGELAEESSRERRSSHSSRGRKA